MGLKHFLSHPLTRNLDIDDPRTTTLRRQIIQSKPFLKQIYQTWYAFILNSLPNIPGQTLELGSGAGFLSDHIPHLITSEIFPTPGVRIILDAHHLPFAASSLRAIVLIDVLHHLSNTPRFFREAQRILAPGGRIVMIEPWLTPFSTFIYRNFHHEPLDPATRNWTFPAAGPLSSANIALPWIIFHRDRANFQRLYPTLQIAHLAPILPFGYLLSGGVSLRSLVPGWSYKLISAAERTLKPWMNHWGMFAEIILEKT